MVTVELGERPVRVWFQHHKDDCHVGEHPVRVITECRLMSEDGSDVVERGLAACSMNDNFNRNLGRKIALSRAVKDFPKSDRKKIWEAYFNARGKY